MVAQREPKKKGHLQIKRQKNIGLLVLNHILLSKIYEHEEAKKIFLYWYGNVNLPMGTLDHLVDCLFTFL